MSTPDPGPFLVGRSAELSAIARAVEADSPILVLGEAGIGKTSLVRAAVAAARRRIFEGGAFSTLDWMPYFALERAVGSRLRGDPAWVAAAVERAVGPDVLFVDDVQWSDRGTLEVLPRLVGRVAFVVAVRRGAPGSAAVLEALAPSGFEVVEIGPLDSADATRLALRLRPDLPSERASHLARHAGGNPFVIEQLVASGTSAVSLRRAFDVRLERLDARTRASLACLALADRPLDRDHVEAADELLRDGLAIDAGDGLVVRHALLAEAMRATLGPDEARSAHARLAELIDEPGERARHLAAAGDRAAAHALALEAAAAATTPGERAAHLAIAATTASGPDLNALRIESAMALRVAGDLPGAAAALDALEAPDVETRALAEAVRARIHWSTGDPEAMRAAIDRGLSIVAGHGTRAEALLRAEAVTVTALVDGRFDEGLADAETAAALALRAGIDPTRALLLRATVLTGLGRPGWAEALEAVIAAAREAGDAETELSAANNLVSGHEMHGRPADGRALATAMLERAGLLRLTAWERQFAAMLASLDLHAGDLRGALARAETLLEEALDPLATQQVGLTAALALVDLGRHEEAAPLLERLLPAAAPDVTGRGDVLFVLAEAALWAGRPADALVHLDAYREYEASEYPTSLLVDVTAGWAALDAGRPIPPTLGRAEAVGMLVGATLERRGIEAMAGADHEIAAALFGEAASAYAGYHRRGELRAAWASGDARRRAGDEDVARAALERVEAEAAAGGFVPLLGRIHRSLRLLGVRRATRAPTMDRSSRFTARERDLAQLAGRGLTNPEIARRMGLGRPTVARLLSSAMIKLGVDSRAQLVARLEELV